VEIVVVKITEVNQLCPGAGSEHPVEGFSQIFVARFYGDIFQQTVDAAFVQVRVYLSHAGLKDVCENVGAFVSGGIFQGYVFEAQTAKMQDGGDFHTGVFIEAHSYNPLGLLERHISMQICNLKNLGINVFYLKIEKAALKHLNKGGFR
jgi:hypothetical protein